MNEYDGDAGNVYAETPEEIMPKKHLSPSQINMFLKCPKSYEYRYVQNLKIPPSGAMKQSSAWHETVAFNYEQKIISHEDLEVDCMKDTFDEHFENIFDNEEIILQEGEERGVLKDQGIAITTEHHKAIAPLVQPIAVEETIQISLGEDFPYELVGKIDCIDNAGIIIDNKAYGKTPSQYDVDKDLQLGCYSLLYRAQKKQIEKSLRLDCIIKTKKPKAAQITTTRTNADCRWLLNLIEKVATAMQSGIFYPNPGNYLCSQKWCGYYSRCKKI